MGDLGTSQDVSFTLGHEYDSAFLSLPDSATVFPPSHPLASYCLELLQVYQCLSSFLLILLNCDVDRNVNKV